MPSRSCPICDSPEKEVLYRQRFARFIGSPHEGYDVCVCSACGMGYADGIPEQAVFGEYYRNTAKYSGAPSREDEAKAWEVSRDVAGYLSQGSGIFEIGSGNGALAAALRTRGFSAFESNIDRFSIVGRITETWQNVLACGVLEHIVDLRIAAQNLAALTMPGGILYVEVPDASSFDESEDAPFQEFSPEHVNFFSAQTLSALLYKNGFRIWNFGFRLRDLGGARVPTIFEAFVRTENSQLPEWHLRSTKRSLHDYIHISLQREQSVIRILGDACADGRINVWGTGSHTLRLLGEGLIRPRKIAAFIDSNLAVQGASLCGVPVIAPEQIGPEPIVISSYGAQEAIQAKIAAMGLKNRVHTFYAKKAASPRAEAV